MPFLRRRQEDEPGASVPASPPPAAEAPPATDLPPAPEPPPPAPEPPPEPPVASQFLPVEGADEMLDMPLGTLIFRAGLIAPQQLEDALAEGLRSGKRLGEVLLARGWLSEEDLSRLLAGQKGLPYADVDRIAIDRELAGAMSYEDARREMALPLVIEFGVPVVAMCDPDEEAMERLRAQIGPEIRFAIAAPSSLARLIDEVLGDAPVPGLNIAPTEPVPTFAGVPVAAELEPIEVAPVAAEEEAPPVDQPAPEQQAPAEAAPIIAEGEIDYPTFSDFEAMPTPEPLGASPEQLPIDVQMGEYGYFGDASLLEGGAWQAGEPGPGAPEQVPEGEPPAADEYTGGEAEQAGAESWEPAPSSGDEIAPEQPAEEAVAEAPVEEELSTTPAWMQGEVNVITADVADFIDAGGSPGPEAVAPEPVENWEGTLPGPETAAPESVESWEGAAAEPSADEGEIAETAAETEAAAEATSQEPYETPEPVEPAAEPSVQVGDSAAAEAGRGEFELVLRLSDGDRVQIGAYASVEEAQVQAGEVVKQFADVKDGSWPFIGGRYLRPDSIVSIDVEHHTSGWSGSGSRGRMFSGEESA